MFKKWFDFAFKDSGFNNNGASSSGSPAPEPVKPGLGLPEMDEEGEHAPSASSSSESAGTPAATGGFERVYRNAAVKPPRIPYGILKVMSMADSTHLAGMHPEVKRCALLMALEAAGAEIEDLLQDAVIRQRILHDFEEKAQDRLREFEAVKTVDSQAIQAELDRITVQYMVRIQANVDEVARQQDKVRGWQQRKQRECQRMTEAAAFLVPQEGANHRTLTAVLERATVARR
jgi:hypothetical protein